MNSEYRKTLDFVNKHKISIQVIKVERNITHPYKENEIIDVWLSVKVSRDTESFIKKWALGDLDLDDENYTYPALVYGVLYRIPAYVHPTFQEFVTLYFDSDYESVSEEDKRIAKIWYENDIELHENAKRVFGELLYEISDAFNAEDTYSVMLKNENKNAIYKVRNLARALHGDFSALEDITSYNGQIDKRIKISYYVEKMNKAKSPVTREKWYYEIITTFYSASQILVNCKKLYPNNVSEIDMENLKEYLRDRAIEFLSQKVSFSAWFAKVRAATLKTLDLEELI